MCCLSWFIWNHWPPAAPPSLLPPSSPFNTPSCHWTYPFHIQNNQSYILVEMAAFGFFHFVRWWFVNDPFRSCFFLNHSKKVISFFLKIRSLKKLSFFISLNDPNRLSMVLFLSETRCSSLLDTGYSILDTKRILDTWFNLNIAKWQKLEYRGLSLGWISPSWDL